MNKIKFNIFNKISIFNKIKKISILEKFPRFKFHKKILKFNIFDKFKNLEIFKRIAEISTFNKLIILSIFLLFTFLFYLSIPALYDSNRLQNQLKKNLANEFKLNIDISSDITYKILPSPHFEILHSPFYINSNKSPEKIGEIKNLNIYISISNLFNQNELKIKKIKINDSIFNFDKNNLNYIKKYYKEKISEKKFIINKSKLFFNENENSILIVLIKDFISSHDSRSFSNLTTVDGFIFNSPFKIKYQNEFGKIKKSYLNIKLKKINLNVKNDIYKNEEDRSYDILNSINFIGSNINTKFKLKDNVLKFSSINSLLFKEKLTYNGNVNLNPFYFNSTFEIKKLKFNDVISFLFNKNILKNQFLFHENLNGKIILKIKELQNGQIFEDCNINIEFNNGTINFDKTLCNIIQVGKLSIQRGQLINSDKGILLKTNFLFNIKDEKKFHQLFQIPKKYRKPLKTINFEFEKNLNLNEFKIKNIKIDSKPIKNSLLELDDLIDNFVNNNTSQNKNWIEIKNFIKELIIKVNSA